MKGQHKKFRTPKNKKKTKQFAGKRDHDFIAPDSNPQILEKGMANEFKTMIAKTIFFSVTFLAGTLLTVFDIKDNGLTFEGFGFKYSGTLVGVIICICSIICMSRNKPKVTITSK